MAQLESSCCVFVGEGCGILREKDDAAGRPAAPWLPALEPASRSCATSQSHQHSRWTHQHCGVLCSNKE